MKVILAVIYDRQTEKIVRVGLSSNHKEASEMVDREIRSMIGGGLVKKPAGLVVPIQLSSDSLFQRSITLDLVRRAVERPDTINSSGAYVMAPDLEWKPLFEEEDD